jgi:hypothetical protein
VISGLLALALTAVSAEAREPVPTVPLEGVDQVTSLCRALSERPVGGRSANPVERAASLIAAKGLREQAVQTVYRVTVEAPAFRFRRYEPDEGQLVIDTRWPLRAANGWLALDVGRQELALEASPELAERAYRFWRDGQVRLVLTFELEDEAQCGGMELIAPRPLPANAVSLELDDLGGAVLLRGAEDLASPEGSAALAGKGASVRVATVVVLSGHADPAKVTAGLQSRDELKECYTKALAGQPQLRGTVIFQADVGRGGRPGQLRVALDDLDEPTVVSCLHDKLAGRPLAGAESGARVLVPVELGSPDPPASVQPLLLVPSAP